MAQDLVFAPLGGVGEIGMNAGLYGYGEGPKRRWLMVDCGVLFGDPAMTPGIDLIMPDIRFAKAQRADIEALVLTHAHEDHYGAVLDLWPELGCPVYATPFAAAMLEAKRASERGAPKIDVRAIPQGGRFTAGPFEVEFVAVAHSIPESNALAIRTPAGTVVHTGDWKIDLTPVLGPPTDEARLRAIGQEGVAAVIGDSTNALREGFSRSEKEVAESLKELIGSAPGRVAVTTFASNVGRLRAVAEAALACDRQVVVIGRAMHRALEVGRMLGYLEGIPEFLDADAYGYLPRDKVVALMTGSQGEPRAALARIANGDHPLVALAKGDRVIFSSRAIPGNEKAVGRVINGLIAGGAQVITDRTHFVHVSGHPHREELATLYGWLKPQLVVPVHGEELHMAEHLEAARSAGAGSVARVRDGQMIRIAGGPAEVVDEVVSGRMLKDGRVMIYATEPTISERRKLAFAGVVSVALAIDQSGDVAGDPDVRFSGLPPRDDEGTPMLEVIRDTVLDCLDGLARPRRRDAALVASAIERAVRAELNLVWGKKPVCHVSVLGV
ncbi:ribonuclease J [Hansschlegelia beijingensis]|uniref:Ribonuclease J n=1 Tax=Hansschlegelia beijingensis TaxID=1133344 RepID=A0A7W6D588_9HYPH|nr:ribonuclease J [Hansschlegelia beijingensis]MBB3974367.1 ribonuclease J [Hansschlegelia beijingensis]